MAKAESRAAQRRWSVGENSETEPKVPFAYGAGPKVVRAYAGTGKTQAEVAKMTGCTTRTIQKACNRLGLDWKAGKTAS